MTPEDLKQRVIGAMDDFAYREPEEGETWESWFHAAFDMAKKKVSAVIDEYHTTPN